MVSFNTTTVYVYDKRPKQNKTKQKKHTVKTTVRVYLIVEIKPPISDSPEMSLLRR